MFTRSSWLHLRFPFSYFLMPVFLFALAISPNITAPALGWSFFIIHFLLYPASNGYNSYFDKDEKSIGVLKNPPPVNPGLYYLALLFDLVAVVLGFLKVNATFAFMLLVYGLVSKAYSHPSIRLKKYAIASWFITGIFQGLFTLVMCYVGINRFTLDLPLKGQVLWAGVLACMMLMANYPMTQIYQHEEDAKRRDYTLSYRLGIRGTFCLTAIVFVIAVIGFLFFFNRYYHGRYGVVFVLAVAPALVFFLYWFYKAVKDPAHANYTHSLWLNIISATGLNVFFIYFFLDSTQILQAFQ
jgi:4-hydroxybenzoate polyprenyltransferase